MIKVAIGIPQRCPELDVFSYCKDWFYWIVMADVVETLVVYIGFIIDGAIVPLYTTSNGVQKARHYPEKRRLTAAIRSFE